MVRSETTIEKMNIRSIKMRKTIYLFIVTLALNGCVMTQTHKSLVPSKPSAVPDYFSTWRLFDVARADYGRLLTLDPNDANSRFGLALLNQKQGRLVEATEQLSALIAEYPKEPDYLVARANVLADRELYDLALLDMESALKLTPQDPYAYVTRAAIYLRMGRHKRQARADLDRAMQLGLSRADLADLYNKL